MAGAGGAKPPVVLTLIPVGSRSIWPICGATTSAAPSAAVKPAPHFEVSFQTVCNWWDGMHAPASAIYARASLEDGARLHAVMTGAR